MSMWTAIVLIVAVAVFGEALRKRWEAQGKGVGEERIRELEAKIDRLETDLRERVEVLERIVTDDREDLKRKFDYLDKAS